MFLILIIFLITFLLFAFSTLWYFSIGLPDYKKLSNYSFDLSKPSKLSESAFDMMIGLAIYMGFKKVYLVGCDYFSIPYENGHFKNISTKASRNNRDRLKLELIPDLRSKEIFPSNVRGVLSYKINGIPKSEVIDLSTSKLISKQKNLLNKNSSNLSFYG